MMTSGPSFPGRAVRAISCEVVIVRQRPEDRNRGDSRLAKLSRRADRVEGLGDREQRAREEADLVPGHDGDGASRCQIPRHRLRLRNACAKGLRRNPGRRSEEALAARGGSFHRRRVGKELGKAAEEIVEERSEAGVAVERDRARQHGFLARTIRRGESLPAGPPSKSPHAASTARPAPRNIAVSSSAV